MNCGRCGVEITKENQDPWIGKSWCNACGKKYRSDYNTRWAKSHRSIVNERARTRYLKVKLVAVEALGGRCNCALVACWHKGPCSIADHRILQFDHIKGGGNQEALLSINGGPKRSRYYRRVIESNRSGEGKYQLLCANCNWMKRAQLRL
jgi:hypothetical protein